MVPWIDEVKCLTCNWATQNSFELLQVNRADDGAGGVWTAQQWAEMLDGAEIWNGGAGSINRGYDFKITDTDPTVQTWNSPTDPARKGQIQVSNYATPEFLVECNPNNWVPVPVACVRLNADATCARELSWMFILFDRGAPWTGTVPSAELYGSFNASLVMAHEIGHLLGFDHEDDDIALMNAQYPVGGNPGGDGPFPTPLRLQAHEYEKMRTLHLDLSTGINLMLWKFAHDGVSAYETWTAGTAAAYGEDWDLDTCPVNAVQAVPAGEMQIAVTASGISSAITTEVEFRLMSRYDTDCATALTPVNLFDPVQPMRVSVTLTPGEVSYVQPPSIGAGEGQIGAFKLCAIVDPDNLVTEVSDDDNVVASDLTLLWECN